MKIFISWSGAESHKVACILRDWLPSVIQSVTPYVSSEDIDKGARWSTDIAKELEDSGYGIICVTPSNLAAPWINFEAGALSKKVDKAYVTPFLFRVKRSEVSGPLLQFQSTVAEKDDVIKMLRSVNGRIPEAERLKDMQLAKAFEVWWPQLEAELSKIPLPPPPPQSSPPQPTTKEQSDILEEILDLVRQQQRVLNSPESLLPPPYLEYAFDKFREVKKDDRFREIEWERVHEMVISVERCLITAKSEDPDVIRAKEIISELHDRLHRALEPRLRRRRPISIGEKVDS